jgi:hypothetical protein
MKILLKSVIFIFLTTIQLYAIDFGYIGYSTQNIGDDIQAIAARQFLPRTSICVDRDFISKFQHHSKVFVIVNGWYMIPRSYFSNCEIEKHKFNWPPSAVIDPILISIHFTKPFISKALSPESVEYLMNHGPVGARDLFTLRMLQSMHIPSYFSGCLTLTLTNAFKDREDIVYAVDLDEECINFLKTNTRFTVQTITHEISKELAADQNARLKYAEELLEKYQKARYVVTSRLHAAMPCLAFETPVLLINTQSDQYRFDGLKELVRNCNRKEFLQGFHSFDLENPEENAKSYLPIRENLVNVINNWVSTKIREL